jgi:protein-S-isoprenylcysteine O-methyltransferase Ste14
MVWSEKCIVLSAVLTIICIVCFPVNPLVLTGVLRTNFYPSLFIGGWVVWGFGMALVLSPIILFPRRGGVPKGTSFVHTTHLVDTGFYAIVRHPQYLGGILAIFVTTLLWYPHWVFAALGAIGAVLLYISARDEEQTLTQQFGDEYIRYMQRVPRMNLVVGVVRLLQKRES